MMPIARWDQQETISFLLLNGLIIQNNGIKMNIDPNYVSPEQHYTTKDKVGDFFAALFMSAAFFIFTWIAFAMDVITTGM